MSEGDSLATLPYLWENLLLKLVSSWLNLKLSDDKVLHNFQEFHQQP